MNATSWYTDEVLQRHSEREEQAAALLLFQSEQAESSRLPRAGRILAAGPYGASQPAPGGSQLQHIPTSRMNGNIKHEWSGDETSFATDDGLEIALMPSGYESERQIYSSSPRAMIIHQGRSQPSHQGQASYGGSNAFVTSAVARRPLPFPASIVGEPGDDARRQLGVMQSKLAQRLGPEYLSVKPGPAGAGKLHYIENFKILDLANEVFGFNGWSCSIIKLDIDFLDELPGGRFSVGVGATVRVTLRDGTFHEDTGYGSSENLKSKAQALDKSKKEAVTDARKRALKNFGRLMGNCVYDRKYVDTASKIKVNPPDFDIAHIKRGPEVSTYLQHSGAASPPQAPQPQQNGQGQRSDSATSNGRHQASVTVAREQAAASTSTVTLPTGRAEFEAISTRPRPASKAIDCAEAKTCTPSPTTARKTVPQSKQGDEAAREQRRAQAAQRQAELRRQKQMQQDSERSSSASKQTGTSASAERPPLQPLSPQVRTSSDGIHTRTSPQSTRPKITPPQQASLSPHQAFKQAKAAETEELFLGDINFSQYSDDGARVKAEESFDFGGDTTPVEPAPAPAKLATRPGRFIPSPTTTNKPPSEGNSTYPVSPTHKRQHGARSLVASQQRMSQSAPNKRAHITSASHAYSNGNAGADKRARYAPAR